MRDLYHQMGEDTKLMNECSETQQYSINAILHHLLDIRSPVKLLPETRRSKCMYCTTLIFIQVAVLLFDMRFMR